MKKFILLIIPFLTYSVSYVYLAFYHGKLNLLNTIIHEGGQHTFIETTFYLSHFLGHLPIITVYALYFVGCYFMFSDLTRQRLGTVDLVLAIKILFLFVSLSLIFSYFFFGFKDTNMFILQQKQSVITYGQGGAWNLHLPSTMMAFIFIPIYIYVVIRLTDKVQFCKEGTNWLFISLGLFLVMTFLTNYRFIYPIVEIWTNPRYLGHSVRELLTFPLTYYPIPLYFFLKWRIIQVTSLSELSNHNSSNIKKVIKTLLFIFILAFLYQVYISLYAGLGNITQKPEFSDGKTLNITYLLSSHYFEHFLDTIYFALLSICIYKYTIIKFRRKMYFLNA